VGISVEAGTSELKTRNNKPEAPQKIVLFYFCIRMEALLKKLNYKNHAQVVLINLPADLQGLADTFAQNATVYQSFDTLAEADFALVFATKQSDIDDLAPTIAQKVKGDNVVWFAYPKGTSKKYKCDFNRDTGWQTLGGLGFEGVRMVAIDEDWSALRFRRIEFIKNFQRNEKMAMSEEGKKRTQK
jgi:hypothetical protein